MNGLDAAPCLINVSRCFRSLIPDPSNMTLCSLHQVRIVYFFNALTYANDIMDSKLGLQQWWAEPIYNASFIKLTGRGGATTLYLHEAVFPRSTARGQVTVDFAREDDFPLFPCETVHIHTCAQDGCRVCCKHDALANVSTRKTFSELPVTA